MLDFTGLSPSQSSVARASEMSYTQMHKSINRFYAWGYAKQLEETGLNKKELLKSETPAYEQNKKISKTGKGACMSLGDWQRKELKRLKLMMRSDWIFW